jgi:hypothetical protein
MSIRGQTIAAVRRPPSDQPLPDVVGVATAVLLFFLINLVAIAAFLATAAQAAAADIAVQTAPAVMTLVSAAVT